MTPTITQTNVLIALLEGHSLKHALGMEDFGRLVPVGGGMFEKVEESMLRGMKRGGLLDGRKHFPYECYTLTTVGRQLAIGLKMEADPSWVPAAEPESAVVAEEETNMATLEAPVTPEVVLDVVKTVALEAGVPAEVVDQAVAQAIAPKPAKAPRAPKPALDVKAALAEGESFQAGQAYAAVLLAQDTNWTGAFLAQKPSGKEKWSTVQHFPDIKRALKVKIARQVGDGDGVKEVCNFVDVSQPLVLVAK